MKYCFGDHLAPLSSYISHSHFQFHFYNTPFLSLSQRESVCVCVHEKPGYIVLIILILFDIMA